MIKHGVEIYIPGTTGYEWVFVEAVDRNHAAALQEAGVKVGVIMTRQVIQTPEGVIVKVYATE